MHQGQCCRPRKPAGFWIGWRDWNRLSAPDNIRQALGATGRVNSLKCILTHEVILWVVLAMGLFTDLPIRQVFKHARRLRKGDIRPSLEPVLLVSGWVWPAPSLVHPDRPAFGPAHHARSVLRRIPLDGHRQHGL